MNWLTLARRGLFGLTASTMALVAYEAKAQPRGGGAIDRFIRARMEAKGIPGAGVAVMREGRTLRTAAYGKANLEFDIDADTRTVFPMASSSKMVAGFAAALLTERGQLDLDAPIRTYVSELPERFAAVRVSQLLSHTSGLGGLGGNPAYVAANAERERREQYVDERKLELFTPAELIAYGADVPFQETPGSAWRYSQFPYFLFGQIVERVSGASYDAFATDNILRPLGMHASVFGDHRTIVPRRTSTNYTRQFGPLQNFALRYTPGYWMAAGLNTTAVDATRFLTAFEAGRLVNQASLDRLWAPTRLNDGREIDYGLGFALGEHNGRRWAGHEGGGCCYVSWLPRERLGVTILFNLSGSREDGVDLALADELLA